MWHPGRREPFLFMLFSLVFVGWWIYLSNDNDQADPRVEKNKRTWMTKRVSTAPVVVPKFSFRDRWNSNTWQRINVILIFLRYLFMFVSVSRSLCRLTCAPFPKAIGQIHLHSSNTGSSLLEQERYRLIHNVIVCHCVTEWARSLSAVIHDQLGLLPLLIRCVIESISPTDMHKRELVFIG